MLLSAVQAEIASACGILKVLIDAVKLIFERLDINRARRVA
jgi:hypothetical protein